MRPYAAVSYAEADLENPPFVRSGSIGKRIISLHMPPMSL